MMLLWQSCGRWSDAPRPLNGMRSLQGLARPIPWHTRHDPFEDVWPEVVAELEDNPGLRAPVRFNDPMCAYRTKVGDGRLRTVQRHIWQQRCAH